jgi:hypothetical protein
MSHASPDKLIVSNFEKLTHKYGSAGASKVSGAVKKLIKADGVRGIDTLFVDLSDAATMKRFGATPIPAASAGDAKLNKTAIDAVFTHGEVRPAYLMLLGSTDVVPHILLDNPLAGDGDPDLPSDLPYACDQPYSTNVQDFIAPTRVVGRLPSVTNDSDPAYLLGLLETAANYSDRPAANYNANLSISAHIWKKSSELSLDAVFGSHTGMKVSPPDGYKWTAAEAKRLAHFVNCHGAPADPHFYGQKGASLPVAHAANWMNGKVAEGTVIAAECCYGAELYDPALPTAAGQMGICNTYLQGKAYACFGSTNIAYGPSNSNNWADLMCQYFLLQLLAGASAGRACLQTRLDYVHAKGGVLTPTDLKTLGQFNLMADPSLTPIAEAPHVPAIAAAGMKAAAAAVAVARHARLGRRAALVARALAATAFRLLEPAAPHVLEKSAAFGKLRKLASELGIKTPDVIVSYSVGKAPPLGGAKGLLARAAVAGPAPKAVHAVLKRLDPPKDLPHLRLVRGLEAVEYDDGMDAREIESR